MPTDPFPDSAADPPRVALDGDGEMDAPARDLPAPQDGTPSTRQPTVARLAGHAAPDLMFVGLATLAFLVIDVLLALANGVPFVLPTESVSPALGMHYLVPLAVTLVGYLAAQFIYQRLGDGERDRRQRLGEIAIDGYLIGLFVVIMYGHLHIKMWMPIINPTLFDGSYMAIDEALRFLIDGAGSARLAVLAVLPRADSWYQGGLLAMFALSFWFHAVGRRQWYYHNMTAILLLEMIGPLTYLIAPAVGPFIFEAGPNAAITGAQMMMHEGFVSVQVGGAPWLAQHGGDYFTAPPAAMPSLHVAVAWVMTYYAVKARSAVSPIMLLLLGWIIVESVVLRWHYLVDLPAGVALAALVIAITNRICRHRLEGRAPAIAG